MKACLLLVIIYSILIVTVACASQAPADIAAVSTTEAALESIPASSADASTAASDTSTPIASDEAVSAASGSPVAGQKRVASDGATMQTADSEMPTRVIENGTRINMHFGDTVLPGILNDSQTAQALIAMLPYTVHMNAYSHDFCGVMPDELPYSEEEVHYGWLNGDIDYAIDAPYFTILHSDEDDSTQYGYQVNIGVLDCELSRIRDLSGSYDVLIELA